jgi:ribosomal protein S27AE
MCNCPEEHYKIDATDLFAAINCCPRCSKHGMDDWVMCPNCGATTLRYLFYCTICYKKFFELDAKELNESEGK